jgi:hypothetical protein
MKYLLLSLLFVGSSYADTFRVLVRQDHSTKTVYREVQLTDLERDKE